MANLNADPELCGPLWLEIPMNQFLTAKDKCYLFLSFKMPDTPGQVIEDKRRIELRYVIPEGKITNFFQGLKDGKVMATRCEKCKTLYFPPQASCPKCNTEDLSWIELSGEATLETFTEIIVKPSSFSNREDYLIAVGRMREGINILAALNLDRGKDARIGMKLKLVPVEREGSMSYEFFPGV